MSGRRALEEAGEEDDKRPSIPSSQQTYAISVPSAPGAPGAQRTVEIEVPVPYPVSVLEGENGVTWFGNFGISSVGLIINNEVTEDEYYGFLNGFGKAHNSFNLVLGDWLAFGAKREWGVTYDALSAMFNYSVDTLYNFAYVCGSVQISLRHENLTFTHYQYVAAESFERQKQLLEMASNGDGNGRPWSTRRLQREVEGVENTVVKMLSKASANIRSRFDKVVEPFETRALRIALKAKPEDREAMADRLIELAKRIKSGK